jgi:hypothetical protein
MSASAGTCRLAHALMSFFGGVEVLVVDSGGCA